MEEAAEEVLTPWGLEALFARPGLKTLGQQASRSPKSLAGFPPARTRTREGRYTVRRLLSLLLHYVTRRDTVTQGLLERGEWPRVNSPDREKLTFFHRYERRLEFARIPNEFATSDDCKLWEFSMNFLLTRMTFGIYPSWSEFPLSFKNNSNFVRLFRWYARRSEFIRLDSYSRWIRHWCEWCFEFTPIHSNLSMRMTFEISYSFSRIFRYDVRKLFCDEFCERRVENLFDFTGVHSKLSCNANGASNLLQFSRIFSEFSTDANNPCKWFKFAMNFPLARRLESARIYVKSPWIFHWHEWYREFSRIYNESSVDTNEISAKWIFY